MGRIEALVVLPKNAQALASFGRNYAYSDYGKVTATYLIPSQPLNIDEGCEVMLEDLSSRPCTKKEFEQTTAASARDTASETPAGERRWYKTTDELPYISDGGCQQVSVEYDTTTDRILVVECNGEA